MSLTALTSLSIRRPVFAWTLMIGIILFGSIDFQRLGVSYLPDIDYPTLEIDVNWQGAAPEVLEAELVDPIEQNEVAVEGVHEVRSVIGQGYAEITLELNPGRNVDAALQEVETHLQAVTLPLNVPFPVIRKRNVEDDPIVRVVVYGEWPLRDIADYVDKSLETEIQTVSGVGDLTIGGFGSRELRIWLNNAKMVEHQITALDVAQALNDQHQEVAAGYLENRKEETNVRTLGEGLTADEVGNELILRRGGQPIYNSTLHLRDVARVEDGLSDLRQIVRFDGVSAISLDIKKQRGCNEVEVADQVARRLKEIGPDLPKGLHLQTVVDFTRFTKQAVDQTLHELLVACVLTSLICYLFLGNLSSSINVLVAIPTSIIGAFMALYLFHFTLNLFTLLALALAIGIVVDDAIMVLENIMRHFALGKAARQAAEEGTHEISFAALAATISVVAIFVPVALVSGVIGYFLFQFAITMIVAVVFSLLEALTLTPMRASKLLKRTVRPGWIARAGDIGFSTLAAAYQRTLKGVLRFPFTVVVLCLAVFGVSLTTFRTLRQEFVPGQDQNFIRIVVEAPLGTSLFATDRLIGLLEVYLKNTPEVAHYVSNTGHDNNANEGRFDVVLVDKASRNKSQAQVMAQFKKDFKKIPELKGTKITFRDLSTRGLSSRAPDPISFDLRGPEYSELVALSETIMQRLDASGLVSDLDTDDREGMPELQIIPDREAAAVRGVSINAIGETINVAIGGAQQGKFTSGGHRYDVLLRLEGQERSEATDIGKLQVRNQFGELLPLSDLVHTHLHRTLQVVSRTNRQRSVTISGNVAPGVSQQVALDRVKAMSGALLPPGYSFHLSGSSAGFAAAFDSLWYTLVLGLVVAYLILAVQFDSFIHPIAVLMALPFCLTGALAALWMTNQSINLFSMIGVILLMGIAKKNSILLVDFANRIHAERKEGDMRDSLLRACPIRLRPILMTSLATISSAFPSAMGWGPGAENRVPMALAVIGGILVSTLFTLYVVPCVHVLLNGEGRFDRRNGN